MPIPWEFVGNASAVTVLGALLVWIFYRIVTGKLLPVAEVEKRLGELRTQIEQRRESELFWRDAAMTAMGQTGRVLPVADVGIKAINTLAERTGVVGGERS